jgi:hypothetical protein
VDAFTKLESSAQIAGQGFMQFGAALNRMTIEMESPRDELFNTTPYVAPTACQPSTSRAPDPPTPGTRRITFDE